ncbi:MAG TPA: DEAD/DEAH box helicase [Caldilineaceae bacterium]|nr:DEAD/DEAH box helicase [Caldilineaceae bacterium]
MVNDNALGNAQGDQDRMGAGPSFEALGLRESLVSALRDVGYETPTPIQHKTIPLLMAGRDVIGQAPTGTGKTAAFALPILQKLDLQAHVTQALVLTPTRELAVQVAEAFHTYARRLGQVRVLPVYGGQPIQKQLQRLRSGVQVVVGTPGRVMDHLRRGTLDLAGLKLIVLDEADEMLRMGFLEDVEWILAQAPAKRQTALFSATMPAEVRRVADRYLENPATVEGEHRVITVPTITQQYVQLAEPQKLDALVQLLESRMTPGEAILVFVRTKLRADEVAERLQARGYAAEAMQGDMSQAQRESVIRRLRSGQLELVVATDVAARGLDVERIGLVINYDIPNDPEWYVHRIGRTARAGRSGSAVLFVTPREQRLLREIERYIGQPIERMRLPTQADIAARRVELFKEQILRVVEEEDLDLYLSLVQELAEQSGRDMAEIAAGAAWLARRDKPLLAVVEEAPVTAPPEDGMVRLFIDAGRQSGIRPTDIVGAIANEAGVPGRAIGAIDIYDRFAFVEVPAEYQEQVLASMAGAKIRNQRVSLRVATPRPEAPSRERGERMGRRLPARPAARGRSGRPRPPAG